MLPAVELQFNYISRDKRRRCYILLDDDPQQALQVNNTHIQKPICSHTHTHTLLRPSVWEIFDSCFEKTCILL